MRYHGAANVRRTTEACISPVSAYDHQILQVYQWMLATYVAADGIALVALIAAIVGGYLGYRNLRVMRLSLLLFLEQDMSTRKREFYDAEARLRDANASERDRRRFEEAKESYFNTFERLAAFVLWKYFPGEELALNYYHSLRELITACPADFAAETHYKKMLTLYQRWSARREFQTSEGAKP